MRTRPGVARPAHLEPEGVAAAERGRWRAAGAISSSADPGGVGGARDRCRRAAALAPAARNARPRVVRSRAAHAWLPPGPRVTARCGGTRDPLDEVVRTSAVERRASWVSPVAMSRCASTGTAMAWTSSGSTWSRPARAAWARAARSRWSCPRGRRPAAGPALVRVAVTRSTTYCLSGRRWRNGRGPPRSACATVAASVTGLQAAPAGWRRRAGRACPASAGGGRVAHRDPRHEPVALGLRQRVGALHLDGVLGGHAP